MRNKMIIAVSLVVAGVMTYLMFSGLDEDFTIFLGRSLLALESCLGLLEKV